MSVPGIYLFLTRRRFRRPVKRVKYNRYIMFLAYVYIYTMYTYIHICTHTYTRLSPSTHIRDNGDRDILVNRNEPCYLTFRIRHLQRFLVSGERLYYPDRFSRVTDECMRSSPQERSMFEMIFTALRFSPEKPTESKN